MQRRISFRARCNVHPPALTKAQSVSAIAEKAGRHIQPDAVVSTGHSRAGEQVRRQTPPYTTSVPGCA
eukprot:3664254-Rhodomonas_salina.2